jgi:hypothetical protein
MQYCIFFIENNMNIEHVPSAFAAFKVTMAIDHNEKSQVICFCILVTPPLS